MLRQVISLLDRFTPLAHDMELDHAGLLVQFAEPIYETFQRLHLDYVQAYVGYRKSVSEWTSFDENINAFCNQLAREHRLFDIKPAPKNPFDCNVDCDLRPLRRYSRARASPLRRKLAAFNDHELRPVLRNFVQSIGGYLKDRWNELYRSESGFWPFPELTLSVMTQFHQLGSDPTKSEEQKIGEVLAFIDLVLARLASSKAGFEAAYVWQRTKLLR